MTRRLAVLLFVLLFPIPFSAADQDPGPAELKIEKADTIRAVLAKQIGKRVTVKLESGDELTGTVRLAGDHVVHLSELTGKDFYDAVVDIESVAAEIVRVRGA